jgi:hypothetical protein
MPEPADQPAKHGRSLKGFYITLGVIAALVSLGVALTPMARLQYHAWKYRTLRDSEGNSLKWVVSYAVQHHLDRTAITRLLGKPDFEGYDQLLYMRNPFVSLGPAPLLYGYQVMTKDNMAFESHPLDKLGDASPVGGPCTPMAQEPKP